MEKYRIAAVNKCLQCGKPIVYGRSDKKFCCEECRNGYNNYVRKIHYVYKNRIDDAIRHNYTVLNNLVKLKISQISIDEANAMGLNPNFVTTHIKTSGKDIYNCYDISFRVSDKRIFNIHRLELYLQDNKDKK